MTTQLNNRNKINKTKIRVGEVLVLEKEKLLGEE